MTTVVQLVMQTGSYLITYSIVDNRDVKRFFSALLTE